MKTILTLFVLLFSSLVVAEDISDFEIEGMSIGDSLLDYYNKNIINNAEITNYPNSNKYFDLGIIPKKESKYDFYIFSVKENDYNYIIYDLRGVKIFENEINECKKFKNSIIREIDPLFLDSEKSDYEYIYEKLADGKSISYITDYNLESGAIRIYCNKWSSDTKKKFDQQDAFVISISTQEHLYWISNEAY